MVVNYPYITDFHKSRENRIGASDIPHLIPHPTIQIESLAAYSRDGKHYPCTALDLYNEKINGKPWEYSFPADMGHYLEGKALREFIADNISSDIADEFYRGYMMHKLEQEYKSRKAGKLVCVNPEPYNTTPFKHNTEMSNEYGVAHADCVYVPSPEAIDDILGVGKIKLRYNDSYQLQKIYNGLTIDLSKPFLIEAKSANLYSVQARKNDIYKGYDLSLKTWQGVPLRVYFQTQFQMALYKVDTCYISLIFNTSEKHYWQIKANKKHQAELIQIAQYMKKCIDTKTPPKQLLMNSKDIAKLYPEIKEDFRELKDDELQEVLKIASEYYNAKSQSAEWGKKEKDLRERFSIHLKDTETIKGYVGGKLQTIAKWKYTGGGKRLAGLKEISEREDSKKLLKYLEKNELVKESEKNKIPDVVIRVGELEEIGGEE